jgi:hypothetical protein
LRLEALLAEVGKLAVFADGHQAQGVDQPVYVMGQGVDTPWFVYPLCDRHISVGLAARTERLDPEGLVGQPEAYFLQIIVGRSRLLCHFGGRLPLTS